MIVRSIRGIDLLATCVLALAMFGSLAAADQAMTVTRVCDRPRRMMCETIDVADYAIAGLNPVFLALALFAGIVLAHFVLRLWAGWSIRLSNGNLLLAGLFNLRPVPLDHVEAIGIWPDPLGISSRIDVYTRGGKRLFARNCNSDDALAFAEQLRPLLPPR